MKGLIIYSIDYFDILSVHTLSFTYTVSQISTAVVRKVSNSDNDAVIPAVNHIIGYGSVVFKDRNKWNVICRIVKSKEGDGATVDIIEKVAWSGRSTVVECIWNDGN